MDSLLSSANPHLAQSSTPTAQRDPQVSPSFSAQYHSCTNSGSLTGALLCSLCFHAVVALAAGSILGDAIGRGGGGGGGSGSGATTLSIALISGSAASSSTTAVQPSIEAAAESAVFAEKIQPIDSPDAFKKPVEKQTVKKPPTAPKPNRVAQPPTVKPNATPQQQTPNDSSSTNQLAAASSGTGSAEPGITGAGVGNLGEEGKGSGSGTGSIGTSAEPDYLNNPRPEYPKTSRRRNEQGTVFLAVDIDSAGAVLDVRIKQTSSFKRLDLAALNAVRRWKFKPAQVGGIKIKSTVTVPIEFRLEG